MLDRTFILPPRACSSVNVTVTEKRAPTDASVEMLKEYQDKALEWAQDAVDHRLTSIAATVVEFAKCPWDRTWKVAVKINSRQLVISFPEPLTEAGLVDVVRDALALELTRQLFTTEVSRLKV